MSIDNVTCDWCGKEFPMDTDSFIEAEIEMSFEPEDGEEWKSGDEAASVSFEDLDHDSREHLKSELDLDDEQLSELLSTGRLSGVGSTICPECRNHCEE